MLRMRKKYWNPAGLCWKSKEIRDNDSTECGKSSEKRWEGKFIHRCNKRAYPT